MKTMFMEMVDKMTMSYSYKPVFMSAFIQNMNGNHEAVLEDVVNDFIAFYENGKAKGLPADAVCEI